MRTFIRTVVAIAFCVQAVSAAELPPRPKEGFGVFLIVFGHHAGTSAEKQATEPFDVTKLGGVEHERRDGVSVVTLPLQAWADVEAHPQVAYAQRVWMGEPLEKWGEGRLRHRLQPLASETGVEPVPASWDSGIYAYDGIGNITAIGSDRYAYDSAGRIIEASVGGLTEQYGYDSFGNLTSKKTGTGTSPIPPIDPGSNRVIGYPYDAAGNVTSLPSAGGSWQHPSQYEYDSVGMPVVVQGHTTGHSRRMIYTPDDERIAVMGGGTAKIWIRGFDGKVLREYHGDFLSGYWGWFQDYVWAGGNLVSGVREDANGGRLAFHLDHLGSVRLITRQDKTQLSAHRFLPFGVERTDSTAEMKNFDVNPFRIEPMKFAGHERDFYGLLNVDGTDYLDYMHARFYDSNHGRFLSIDPLMDIKQATASPQAWNRYAYVLNNPVRLDDPDGRSARETIKWRAQMLATILDAAALRTPAGDAIVTPIATGPLRSIGNLMDFGNHSKDAEGKPAGERLAAFGRDAMLVGSAAFHMTAAVGAGTPTRALMLGKAPRYVAAAGETGARALNVSQSLWTAAGRVPGLQEKIVRLNIDYTIARGGRILFSNDPYRQPGG